MIKNLSQLKRALKVGTDFEITGHCRPECIGERRRVNYVDTTGFYSIVPRQPESRASKANGGRGSYLRWSNAPYWKFEGGKCGLYSDKEHTERELIIEIRVEEAGHDGV